MAHPSALQARLEEPRVAESLSRILDRLDEIETAVGALASAVHGAPAALAMTTDIVDATQRDLRARGIDLDERVRSTLALVERLTEPKTMDSLNRLLDLAEQAPAGIAMMADIADEMLTRRAAEGRSVDLVARQGARAAAKLADVLESPEFDALLASGVLDPSAVGLVGKAGGALVESRAEARPVGALGLYRALKDPSIRRALGLLVAFGRRFGQALESER